MDAVTYSGNNSTQTISLNFNPDFIWLKCRNFGRSHRLIDTVRGIAYQLFSNSTDGGSTYDATSYASSVSAVSSSGFELTNSGSDQYNTSGETYVAWAWDCGSSTVTNTSGSISSQVRASATNGCSVVSWTSDGSTSITSVGHGLNAAPQFIVFKNRDAADNWVVIGHPAFTNLARDYLNLNLTNAKTTNASDLFAAPTSTTFSIKQSTFGSNGNKMIAYCFAPVAGFSAFGSYTGNGSSDGPFVFTGHRSRWIMLKRTDTSADWYIFDTARNTYNALTSGLFPNASDAEATNSLYGQDFLSNGWKIRSSQTQFNASGGTYVYASFAESPFKYSRAR
jgi:hypothetical protein